MITFLRTILGVFLHCLYIAMFSNDIDPQKTPIFSCNLCDYNSSNKKDYNRHMQTKKHKINDSQCLAMDFTQKSPYSYN